MIRSILFDMGGVLLNFDPELFVSRLGLDGADAALLRREVFGNVEWVCLDRGSLTEEEALALMCRRIPERLHAAARELVLHWDKERDVVEGMADVVRELHENGYGLYLLTNAGIRHRSYWPNYPAAPYFGDRIMLSAAWRLMKPEAAFFEKAFEMFSLDRAECLFIDDNPVNMEGARRVGLDGVVFFGNVPLLRQRLREKGVNISQ